MLSFIVKKNKISDQGSINMNSFLSFMIRLFITIPAASSIWLISLFTFDLSFWVSTSIALVGGGAVYYGMKALMDYRYRKSLGLTRKEYKYIQKNLEEAKKKIHRLNKSLFSVRSLPQIKQYLEIIRITRRIYVITKKDPRRFYLGEQFFYSHLDSVVELVEKYAFLSTQPIKDREFKESLLSTKRMLEDLNDVLKEDLRRMLSNDIDDLQFELDVAKKNVNTIKESQSFDKGRRWK